MDKYQNTTEVQAFKIHTIMKEDDGICLKGTDRIGNEFEAFHLDSWVQFNNAKIDGYHVSAKDRDFCMSAEDFNSTYTLMEPAVDAEPTPEPTTGLTFSEAFERVRGTYRSMRRDIWGSSRHVDFVEGDHDGDFCGPCLRVKIGRETYPWSPISHDLFATDWEVVK